jgi:signal transduction histidine kinase
VAQEVAQVMHLPMVGLARYDHDADGAVMTVIGAWSDRPHAVRTFHPGTRWRVGGPSMVARVLETGRPVRVDDYAQFSSPHADRLVDLGIRASAGAPIIVDGRVWGVMTTWSRDAPLPEGVEDRLADFTALVGTAISNSQAREDLRRLADDQAALRRVATLVAMGAPPPAVCATVAEEVSGVMHLPIVTLGRYHDDGATVELLGLKGEQPFQPGTQWPVGGRTLASVVHRTRRPARVEDYADVPGKLGEAASRAGVTTAVGAPIVVAGEVWGLVTAATDQRGPLPQDAESRLSQFTALVATAISNSQAREDLGQLAAEQAALQRVATLVARGATPAEVFSAVAEEVAQVTHLPIVTVGRYDDDGDGTVMTIIGGWTDRPHPFHVGTRWPLYRPSLTEPVRRTDCPRGLEDAPDLPRTLVAGLRESGLRSVAGARIMVDGGVWGIMGTASQDAPLPSHIQDRLADFTALVATAISNSQAREDLRRLADEQAALRRLATLVAQGAEPRVVFDAVCQETGRLLGASATSLAHFTSEGLDVTMAGWSEHGVHVPAGTRLPLDGDSIRSVVRDTAAPGRFETYEGASGELADLTRRLGIRSDVGAPVVVEGQVWGALIAASDKAEPLPAGTEHRLASFAELIAAAVSNAAARSELMASRVRIVEAADEQRRRVVRDLHDGAQQRLVHTVVTLKQARDIVGKDAAAATELMDEARSHGQQAMKELRELAHGILPAALTRGGLRTGLAALVSRASVPVTFDVPAVRFVASVEATAYFVVAEALTNVAKHAHADEAWVTIAVDQGCLVVEVRDDGVGGARAHGPGLVGMQDRIAALEGWLHVDSPPGGGTLITAAIPVRR